MGGHKHRKRKPSSRPAAPPAKRGSEDKEDKRDSSDEDLEFEDAFEDEFSEPEVVGSDEEIEDDVEVSDVVEQLKVWRPGDSVAEDEEMIHDAGAYRVLHHLSVEAPCLSFDFIRDSLGDVRTSLPQTAYFVAGTQGDSRPRNKVLVMKASQLSRTEDPDDSSSEEEDENETHDDPILEHFSFNHVHAVNRIRCMPQKPNIVAVTGSGMPLVRIYDVEPYIRLLDPEIYPKSKLPMSQPDPLHTFTGHADEGYALDWSPVVPGRLASGDCRKFIYLWNLEEGGTWTVDGTPFSEHQASVEDIQWSPSQADVFASASVDRTIKVWDSRAKRKSQISFKAHNADVNVISWNNLARFLLASGGDDGTLKVWDFRSLGEPVAFFKYHSKAITSLEWHPSRDSVLLVSSEDDRATIWDMKMEESVGSEEIGVPPQLLFEHGGVPNPKEVHWHPQVKDLACVTCETGFSFFVPPNLDPVPDEPSEDELEEETASKMQ